MSDPPLDTGGVKETDACPLPGARSGAPMVRGIAIALAALGGGVYAVALAAGVIHAYDPNQNAMFAGLMALLLAGVLAAWQRVVCRALFVMGAGVSLSLVGFGPVTGSFSERSQGHGASVAELSAYDDIARFLRLQPELVRIGFNDSFNVYRNPRAFPRVWTLHQTALMQTADQMRAAMADPGFDLRATAPMLEAGPALEKCALPDEAWMTGRNAGSVAFQARMGCRGMLVIADTWYPGWYVTVDGHPAPIYQPYAALRGVVVERGFHTLAMHYRPRSALLGAAMSVAGILLACVLALGGAVLTRANAVKI